MRDAGSGFGIRDSGFGIRDSGIGNRESGVGSRESGVGQAAAALEWMQPRIPAAAFSLGHRWRRAFGWRAVFWSVGIDTDQN
ncbi:hypothetical protein XarbCFBP8153_08950 [Xanthomonas arboricola]|nr:hypothetical protein XarbCFBP8153_08950 [Xanthomonas arboricola]